MERGIREMVEKAMSNMLRKSIAEDARYPGMDARISHQFGLIQRDIQQGRISETCPYVQAVYGYLRRSSQNQESENSISESNISDNSNTV